MVTKPILKDSYVWAQSAESDDILIPYEKIDTGWEYADKPSYQWFNWFWQQVSQFLVHVNQNGVPIWDSGTAYESGGVVKHNGVIFQSFTQIIGEEPNTNSRAWHGVESLDGLGDVLIDMPQRYDILMNSGGIWSNVTPKALDINLQELKNVTVTEEPETIFVTQTSDINDPDHWQNIGIRDFFKNDVNLNDAGNVSLDRPADNEILQYNYVKVWYEPEQTYIDELRWVNAPNKGIVDYNKITGTPDEFIPTPADELTVGGARMWMAGSDLLISTKDVYAINAPYNLTATTDQSPIVLNWVGSSSAEVYNIYMDGTLLDTTAIGETSYEVTGVADDAHHIFYVTSVRTEGSDTIESYPSNYVLGANKS